MPRNRREFIQALQQDPDVQVLVIGGGINGIGTFRELALQGVRVLLVDRGDFCGACSSAPSRMIHGGLRYLENGEFHLVRESLRERDALLRNAPHMVFPLPTTVPIRKVFSGLLNGAFGFFGVRSKPSERGALVIKAGLTFYDFFTRRDRSVPSHVFRGRQSTHSKWPDLQPDLKYSATYHDAWISHPERLGLELIRDALVANENAFALNHADAQRVVGSTIILTDRLSGQQISVKPQVVINATGAWVDETNGVLSSPEAPTPRFVGGTKGSHLILDQPDLFNALGGHMVYFENADGRICILFPYLGKVLLGSTDIRVDDLSDVRCEASEEAYILNSLAYVFPNITVRPEQIVYRFAGVRPLPLSDASFTGQISRDHFTRKIGDDPPILCMVGGKWTTFRAFGQQSADMALDLIDVARIVDTHNCQIGGGKDFPTTPQDRAAFRDTLCQEFSVSVQRAEHALSHYGMQARDVLAFCAQSNSDHPLCDDVEYTRSELRYLVQKEFVGRLDDLLLRRTSLAITGTLSMKMVETAASVLSAEFGWTTAQEATEIEVFLSELEARHGVSVAQLVMRDAPRDAA